MKNKFTLMILPAVILFSVHIAVAQQDHNMNADKSGNISNPAVLIPGLGNYHHKVTTKNKQAQKFFDQGLVLIYAFNHNEAIRSFQKAAELDPMCAMAYWGIAYALGPNYNLPAENDQRKLAYKSMKKAVKHSHHVSQSEKDYIAALSKRYTKDVNSIDQQSLDVAFKNAMKKLHNKYPEDPDAATLYAESLMNLKPWQLWNKDGSPAEGTPEIISVLESVLKNYPEHPGANHYYIHAVEASNDPGKGLASANQLKTLVPSAGHLVHMPAHILFRVGDYEGASNANIEAIKSDDIYIKNNNPQGVYPLMYYNHNINFLSVSRMMEGKYSDAVRNANIIAANVKPMLGQMQMIEGIYTNPLFILFSFGKWDEIISFPEADTSYKLYSSLLHFFRGTAYASKGNVTSAKDEYDKFMLFGKTVTADALIGLTPASVILHIAEDFLGGKIALAEGDTSAALTMFKSAVEEENMVNYDEPPDWYPSVRLTLGAVLYLTGDYPAAESVFRDDLKKYPHNGRGLFGLLECLKAQGNESEAKIVSDEFNNAWKNAEVTLDISGY